MKTVLLFAALLTFSTTAFAQSPPVKDELVERVKSIIEEVYEQGADRIKPHIAEKSGEDEKAKEERLKIVNDWAKGLHHLKEERKTNPKSPWGLITPYDLKVTRKLDDDKRPLDQVVVKLEPHPAIWVAKPDGTKVKGIEWHVTLIKKDKTWLIESISLPIYDEGPPPLAGEFLI